MALKQFQLASSPSCELYLPSFLLTALLAHGSRKLAAALSLTAVVALTGGTVAEAQPRERTDVDPSSPPSSTIPCADDICSTGSTVGPGGDLYVTDSTAGRIQRVDPRRGTPTTLADGCHRNPSACRRRPRRHRLPRPHRLRPGRRGQRVLDRPDRVLCGPGSRGHLQARQGGSERLAQP